MTIIGDLLDQYDVNEGIPELDAEIAALEEEIATLDEQLAAEELSEEDKGALEEKRMSAAEKRADKLRRRLLKKDVKYRKAQELAAKRNKGLDKPKYSVQRDPETGAWTVGKIDLEASKKAKLAAKKRKK